jgi:regulator of ribonuclease activity A
MGNTIIKTADLCDNHIEKLQVVEVEMKDYGKRTIFHGEIVTLKVFEDNTLVRTALEASGKGKVLVIDGGGSKRCALVGGNIGKLAEDNGWEGIVVYGAIRDSDEIAEQNIGLKALATCPVKSIKRNEGQFNINLRFGGVNFVEGHYLYADTDGIVVSETLLM